MEFSFLPTFLLAETGSFGINTNILETNLINQLILGGGLFVLGRDFLSESLTQRQVEIISNVENSEKRLTEASNRLEEAKKQLVQAKVIMDDIKKETLVTQLSILETDYKQTKNEIQRKFSSALTSLKNRERLILAEIKQQISLLALEQVVLKLETQMGSEQEQTTYMRNRITMIKDTVESVV